ncbi:MAG: hypothetical protein ABIO46_07040 [Chitinophagales bacterium]
MIICISQVIAQEVSLNGFVITHYGDSIKGMISFPPKISTPRQIKFRGENSYWKDFSPVDIKSFDLADGRKYESRITVVDVTPIATEDYHYRLDTTILMHDSIFVQVLVEGEISLYENIDSTKRHYFISRDTIFRELVFHQFMEHYLVGQPKLVARRKYVGQLKFYLQDCREIQQDIERAAYTINDLQPIIIAYNKCAGKGTTYILPLNKIKFYLGPVIGFSLAKISFKGTGSNDIEQADFSTSVNPVFGIKVNAEVNKLNSFSASAELFYQAYQTTASFSETISENYHSTSNFELDFAYLKGTLLLNYHLTKISPRIFFNTGISYGYAMRTFNEYVRTDVVLNQSYLLTETLFENFRHHEFGALVGAGAAFGRINAQAKYELSNGIASTENLRSPVNRLYLLVGYIF